VNELTIIAIAVCIDHTDRVKTVFWLADLVDKR
jgi:hypothetical protein